ncbi:hypothetical protein GHK92_17125 [Nocardioides sp. dk4132]|uniref:hypothetical protein n=1 Tax=unclassified Nocardioides TaxID=2615069 RepID=UPI001296C3EF|nr:MULTISPECIES: hypothetical protein [unclassified Nocardioides]MQW77596.1 hypothetical protein [Nocardioides sp. dk4132]QGA06123.1 hypothetical protein GFH29_00985 [Nocardioides sp. dk884]
MSLTAGARLKTTTSALEVVVVTPPSIDEQLLAAGEPMAADVTPGPAGDATYAIGKRYVEETSGIEVLVVKPGPGPLTIGGNELAMKVAKPLPASD